MTSLLTMLAAGDRPPARQKGACMTKEDVPVWVYIMVAVGLPLLGYLSRGLKSWADGKVQTRINLAQSQQDFSQSLLERIRVLEDRMERMGTEHQRELAQVRESYRVQIRSIRDHYETRIAHLERLVGNGSRLEGDHWNEVNPGTENS